MLGVRAVDEAVHVFSRERRRSGTAWEDWHTALKTYVSIGYSPEQRFDKLVHVLAGLVREILRVAPSMRRRR